GNITSGTGNDSETGTNATFIAMGHNNSGGAGAYDIDFFAYKVGVIAPILPTPPPAPTNVVALSGDMSVSLSWAPANGALGYFVFRSSTSGGPYSQVGSASGTSFSDSGLVNGSTNYYVITATNSAGASGNSLEVAVVPNAP